VEVARPDDARALLDGFYAVEDGRWRWTASRFSVLIGVPQRVLRVRFAVPAAALAEGALTLGAIADGRALAPETYTLPGEQLYERPLVNAADPITIDFTVDGKGARALLVSSVAVESR
jgi:hypothetical protein